MITTINGYVIFVGTMSEALNATWAGVDYNFHVYTRDLATWFCAGDDTLTRMLDARYMRSAAAGRLIDDGWCYASVSASANTRRDERHAAGYGWN